MRSTGEVVQASKSSGFKEGDIVFVPGADCYSGSVRSIWWCCKRVISPSNRLIKIDSTMGVNGALFALAATARHAIAGFGNRMPEVIVGHGVLGRLLARLVILAGEKPPIVWEKNIFRHAGATDYEVVLPEFDSRSDYDCIYDVSGDSDILDSLIGKGEKGGEVVMAGFYPERVSFGFAQAFIKEVSVRVSAEFTPEDVATTKLLIEDGSLSFDGLVSDVFQVNKATEAYKVAFEKAECLKNGTRLEKCSMTVETINVKGNANKVLEEHHSRLKSEAKEINIELLAKPKKKCQIIAIYGKGGIGKSFTLANLSCMMAEQGKRVLLIGLRSKGELLHLSFLKEKLATIIETSTKREAFWRRSCHR